MGATAVIHTKDDGLPAKLKELCGGKGPDVIIEAVGLPATYRQAVDLAGFAGRVVYIGYAAEEVAYETKGFVMKELDIRGSRNALKADFDEVVRVLEKGDLPVGEIITRRFPFAGTGSALEFWAGNRDTVTKIIIDYD
jgi:threonine dehydrogenase-like Zn-dependent dehydrogenase